MGLLWFFALTGLNDKYTLLVINLHLYVFFVPAAIYLVTNSKEPDTFYLGVGIILIAIIIGIVTLLTIFKKSE